MNEIKQMHAAVDALAVALKSGNETEVTVAVNRIRQMCENLRLRRSVESVSAVDKVSRILTEQDPTTNSSTTDTTPPVDTSPEDGDETPAEPEKKEVTRVITGASAVRAPHSCSRCGAWGRAGSCARASKVIAKHGDKQLSAWLGSPYMRNHCSLFGA